jgi:hypothetical protein
VVGETEVVVGAEVEHLLSAAHPDVGLLRSRDDPLGLVETGLADVVEGGAYVVLDRREHGSFPFGVSGRPSAG